MGEPTRLEGVGASEGVALGPAFFHVGDRQEPDRTTIPKDAVEEELQRFERAVGAVSEKLASTAERLRAIGGWGRGRHLRRARRDRRGPRAPFGGRGAR